MRWCEEKTMKRWCYGGLLLIAVAVAARGGDAVPAAGDEAGEGGSAHWREAMNCGPNSLYMWLKLEGWDGSLRTVRAHLPVGDRGCSLEEVRRAAGALGHPVDVVKTSLSDLSLPGQLPAIVHLDSRELADGHYVVLLRIGENKLSGEKVVTVLDPMFAQVNEMPVGDFCRNWSTYAVVRKAPTNAWWGWGGVLLVGVGVFLLACVTVGWRFGAPGACGKRSAVLGG
jgi:Peptidase C39 family